MKITDISPIESPCIVSDAELCIICKMGYEFTEYFEKEFIKGELIYSLRPNHLKQILYILDNTRHIFNIFKKAAMYTDYSLTRESFNTAEAVIKRLNRYYGQVKKVKANRIKPYYPEIQSLKAKYIKIKSYAGFFVNTSGYTVFNDSTWPEKTILIGALRNPNQLKVALENEFYHVPVSVAKNVKDIKCIAIYQSKNLFRKNSGVRYYGKVVAVMELPRYEIKEIPSDLDTMYYRFEIDKWKILKNPINADALGEVASQTTLYQLMTAEKTSELHASTKTEYEIYSFMKHFAFTPYPGEICFNNVNLIYDGSYFKAFCDNILKLKISNEDFIKRGILVAKKISEMIKQTDGKKESHIL